MGAWGYEALANDTAVDWTSIQLAKSQGIGVIEAALDAADAIGDGYLDERIGSIALAACETLARVQGRHGYQNSYTATVDQWVLNNQFTPNRELIQKAHQVIDRVLSEDSELTEQWENGAEWRASVENLRKRVG